MISKIHLKNFVHFIEFKWEKVGKLNVIIGENDTGKTNLLKLLYSTSRAWSKFTTDKKNNRDKPFNVTLADKILDTFQPRANGIGDLVSKKSKSKLEVEIVYFSDSENQQSIQFQFSRDAKRIITDTNVFIEPCREENFNSIFIPPKEVLTAFDAIQSTRTEEKWMYGFDDTYIDLIKLLQIDTVQGKQSGKLPTIIKGLEELMNGKIHQRKGEEKFKYRRGSEEYSMSMTAEGIKRIGIYITLINNRQLHPGSVLFLDEPEAELHPKAIRVLGNMIYNFSQSGIQVFVSTHNYFLLKQLELKARENKTEVQCCSLRNIDGVITASFSDLQNGMPDNPIVEVALELFDQEIAIE